MKKLTTPVLISDKLFDYISIDRHEEILALIQIACLDHEGWERYTNPQELIDDIDVYDPYEVVGYLEGVGLVNVSWSDGIEIIDTEAVSLFDGSISDYSRKKIILKSIPLIGVNVLGEALSMALHLSFMIKQNNPYIDRDEALQTYGFRDTRSRSRAFGYLHGTNTIKFYDDTNMIEFQPDKEFLEIVYPSEINNTQNPSVLTQ